MIDRAVAAFVLDKMGLGDGSQSIRGIFWLSPNVPDPISAHTHTYSKQWQIYQTFHHKGSRRMYVCYLSLVSESQGS